jgi:hypothetical protein
VPRRLGVFAAALALTSACERKAPGPAECVQFAQTVSGISETGTRAASQVQRDLDELTERCLTTPYDRELLACVETTRATRGCLAAFNARQASPRVRLR